MLWRYSSAFFLFLSLFLHAHYSDYLNFNYNAIKVSRKICILYDDDGFVYLLSFLFVAAAAVAIVVVVVVFSAHLCNW